MGWAAFLLSAMKWRIGQEKYYKWKGSLFSIECGDSEKIKKIWELIWSIWKTKNDGKHKKNNTLSVIKSETVNSVLIEPEDMIKKMWSKFACRRWEWATESVPRQEKRWSEEVKKVKERSKICENSHASLDDELSGFSPALVIGAEEMQ